MILSPKQRLTLVFLPALVRCLAASEGQDLHLTYRSIVDDTDQPYRVYVPSGYRPEQPIPIALVLHGTGHDQNTFFDERRYPQKDGLRNAAEKHGILAVVPFGRGNTEFKGIGENDVFCVLEDVKKRFRIDAERVYLTGHSMGGLGAAYLGLHHPDQFAAVAPLASAYSFPWIAANAGHLPFLWIGGAEDEEYYRTQVALGVDRMKRLRCPAQFLELPGEGHFGPPKDFNLVFEWMLQHRRVAHPWQFTFEVDTPLHPRAYWITVETVAHPGKVAAVQARAESTHAARLKFENVSAVAVWPDPEVFDAAKPLEVFVEERAVFNGTVSTTEEVLLQQRGTEWTASRRPRREISLTSYRTNPIAHAPETLDMAGTEARLANWITDAMRAATGTEVALYNRAAYRGLPIQAGTVDVVDLIQCSRPWEQYLVTAHLTGRDLVEILDDNIQDTTAQAKRDLLVQLSGGKYVFNRRRPPGQRIVSSSFESERVYTVTLEGQVVERDTTLRLAGRFKKLKYVMTDIPTSLALYRHAAVTKEVRAPLEGRVREEK